MEQTVNIVNNSAPRCPYCHESVEMASSKTACESCMAWHHKECWQEHGACSSCGMVVTQSEATQEAPEPADRGLCVQPDCEEAAQWQSKAKGYRLRCMNHAVKYGQDKVQSQKRALLVLTIPTLLSILGCMGLLFLGNESDNPFLLYPTIFVVTMVFIFNERAGHQKKLKSLQATQSEKTSEKGAEKN